jgi:hypothetical protein
MARVVTGASKIVWPSGAARGCLRRDDRARAGTIVDDDRPLELVLQLLRQQAREHVGAAAGGKRT